MDQLFPVRSLSTRADERGGFVAVVIAVLTGFGSEAMSKMRLIMPRCCLVRVTADEDSSAVFCARQRHSGTAAPYGSSQNCSSTSNRSARSLLVIEPPAQSDRAFNLLHRRTLERRTEAYRA